MSVETLISNAQGYAAGVTGDARSALRDASNLVQMVGYSIPNVDPVALPNAPLQTLALTPPTLADVTLDLPSEPSGEPSFQDISPITLGSMPAFTAVMPTLTLPTQPSQLAAFLEAAPGINTDIAFPEPPDALLNPLIEIPVLPDRAEPAKPQVMLPVFDAQAPTDFPVAPTDHEAKFAAAYRDVAPQMMAVLESQVDAMLTKHNPRYHEQMAAIEAQLSIYLAGGTGLKPAVENAIYERARGKNSAEARRVRDSAFGDAAARGFTLPPGALISVVQQARQAAADNNATAAREIVVLQAEMEQKNLQFAVTTSANLRQTLLSAALSYHQNLISINGQALDYAKTTLSALIEVYNTAVKAFGLKLDAYRAEAVVYETRLKSALAAIELYQAEIKALEALTNVDRAKVDVYRARIDALTSLSNVYRAQIEAVVSKANLEKLKLEVFQSKVQAFTAQVQAKNAEWQGYTAAIGGENAKANLFRIQVDAFGAQMQGFKTAVDAKSEVVRATAATNQARAAQYASTLSGYNAVVQARGEVARTKLENQRQQVIAFQAEASAAVSFAQVQNEYYKSVSLVGIENAKLKISAQMQGAQNQREFGQTIASLGTATAQIYSGLASAAMSGMNTLAGELKNE